jgi:hypothetical protein
VRKAANVPDLDRLIHEKTRLAIVIALSANPSLTFNELKAILETTDSNAAPPLGEGAA